MGRSRPRPVPHAHRSRARRVLAVDRSRPRRVPVVDRSRPRPVPVVDRSRPRRVPVVDPCRARRVLAVDRSRPRRVLLVAPSRQVHIRRPRLRDNSSRVVASQVSLYRSNGFAQCCTCKQIDDLLANAGGAGNPNILRLKNLHLRYVRAVNGVRTERVKAAREGTSDVLSITVDGMDQDKTNIPVMRVGNLSKDDGKGMPLGTKLLGAIAYGYGWYGLWTYPEWGNPSNITFTGLCHVIRSVQTLRGGSLPPALHLQMDNSGRDNKNHWLLGFCALLLKERLFQEVEVYFLPVGHTHCDIDATFSKVASRIRGRGAYSMPDLHRCARTAWSGCDKWVGADRRENVELEAVLDFKGAFGGGPGATPLLYKFRGLGTEGSRFVGPADATEARQKVKR